MTLPALVSSPQPPVPAVQDDWFSAPSVPSFSKVAVQLDAFVLVPWRNTGCWLRERLQMKRST